MHDWTMVDKGLKKAGLKSQLVNPLALFAYNKHSFLEAGVSEFRSLSFRQIVSEIAWIKQLNWNRCSEKEERAWTRVDVCVNSSSICVSGSKSGCAQLM